MYACKNVKFLSHFKELNPDFKCDMLDIGNVLELILANKREKIKVKGTIYEKKNL